jgi:hypothetical protein
MCSEELHQPGCEGQRQAPGVIATGDKVTSSCCSSPVHDFTFQDFAIGLENTTVCQLDNITCRKPTNERYLRALSMSNILKILFALWLHCAPGLPGVVALP